MNTSLLTHRWQHLPERTIHHLQMARLRRYLEEVVLPFSPYYRALFRQNGLHPRHFKRWQDLNHIPFTTKEDLSNTAQHPKRVLDFLIRPDPEVLRRRPRTLLEAIFLGRETVRRRLDQEYRPVFMTSTTGRSADPIPFLYTRHDLRNLAVGGDRIMQVCGAQKDFRLINMFPYAPHLAFWITHYASTEFGIFTVGSGGGKVMGTEGNLRLIKKLDPHVLIGMPTFLYHVLQQAVEEGLRCPNLRRLVLGGEKVAAGMRRKLRQLARLLGADSVDILATYGFTEAKLAWAECPYPSEEGPSGYHLYPDLGIFEVIDPITGMSLPPGHPGELVFTPLDARGTVVMRYRTGDLIEGGLVYEPCPYCKRCVPGLLGNISRNSEIKSMHLDKIKGTLVDFNQLEHVLDDAPHIDAWQLEIRKVNNDPLDLDELILHVHESHHASREQVSKDLTSRFLERTEIRPNQILFHDAGKLRELLGVGTQLKEQKIIDNRPVVRSSPMVAGARASSQESPDRNGAREPVGRPRAAVANRQPTEVTS